MRSADAEPNSSKASECHDVFGFTASRTDPLIMIVISRTQR